MSDGENQASSFLDFNHSYSITDASMPSFDIADFTQSLNIENNDIADGFSTESSLTPPLMNSFTESCNVLANLNNSMQLNQNVQPTNQQPMLNSFYTNQMFTNVQPPLQNTYHENIPPFANGNQNAENDASKLIYVIMDGVSNNFNEIQLRQQISIELASDIWEQLVQLPNEMIVNKKGRKMFPELSFKVTGLESDITYLFHIGIKRQSAQKLFTYLKTGWAAGFSTQEEHTIDIISHENNHRLLTGANWMKNVVTFRLILSCATKTENQITNMVNLKSCFKYVPIVYVDRYDRVSNRFVRFTEKEIHTAEFIAVASYRNKQINNIKTGKSFEHERRCLQKKQNCDAVPVEDVIAQPDYMPQNVYNCKNYDHTSTVSEGLPASDARFFVNPFDGNFNANPSDGISKVNLSDGNFKVKPSGGHFNVNPSDANFIVKNGFYVNPSDTNLIMNPSDANLIVKPSDANIFMKPSDSDISVNPSYTDFYVNSSDDNFIVNPSDTNYSINSSKANCITNSSDGNIYFNQSDASFIVNPSDGNFNLNPSDANFMMKPADANFYENPPNTDFYVNPSDDTLNTNSSDAPFFAMAPQTFVSNPTPIFDSLLPAYLSPQLDNIHDFYHL